MNSHTFLLLTTDIYIPLPLSLLYSLTASLLSFFHLLSFQRHEFICKIFEELISQPLLWTLLLHLSHPKSLILLLPSLLSSFFFSSVFSSFCFLLPFFYSPFSLLSFASAILTFSALVSATFHTYMDILLFLLYLFSS